MEVDYREFLKATKAIGKKTGRDFPESVNRGMSFVLYRSKNSVLRKTPKTTKAKILRSLAKRGDMFERIAAKELRKQNKRATPEAVAAKMKEIVDRRSRGIGYTGRAGWANAIRKFGGTRISPPRSGVAKQGTGQAATPKKLEAYALNAVGAELEPGEIRRKTYAAVQSAVDSETENILDFLAGDIESANKKHGGR